MKCKECDREMTDKQAIAALEKRVKQLENDLLLERMRVQSITYIPYVPYAPEPVPQLPYTWFAGDFTGTGNTERGRVTLEPYIANGRRDELSRL